ncbi:MAG: hypothetical protein K5979_10085, partial [Ruminococcus sp.]|nr:hypothetical protein [Ruminococcus sp.]
KFKFLSGKDNEFVIVTKASGDRSAVEIADGSENSGANVQQFRRNGKQSQSWILEPVEERVIYGDINEDERVDAFDLVVMRKLVVNGWYHSAADMNDDDKIGAADLVQMERFLMFGDKFERSGKGTPVNTIFPKV